MTKTTLGSLEYAACVLIGLTLAYHDGVDLGTCLLVAGLASALYVAFLTGRLLWRSSGVRQRR